MSSLPTVSKDGKKQFQSLNVVFNNKTWPLQDSLQAFFSFSIPFNMHILTEVSTGVDVSYNLFSIIKSLKGLLQINK